MRRCPACNEEYDDNEFSFCMFDGTALSSDGADLDAADSQSGHKWRVTLTVLFVAALIGGASLGAITLSRSRNKPVDAGIAQSASSSRDSVNAVVEPLLVKQTVPLSKMGRTEILEMLPKNLLRWFRAGSPDELRLAPSKDGDHIVLIGSGRSGSNRATQRIVVLKNDGEEFQDVTRQTLPAAYGSGVFGARSHVKFDAAGVNVIIRIPASSTKIVDECPSCEHAYQRVTLEWRETRYVETERVWDNDRYTAFYVVAEALERRRVEPRARPLIDSNLDGLLSNGFPRSDLRGWLVENLTEVGYANTAQYQLRNGTERLTITVAKVNGHWRATRVSGYR
jgi:hypothetical protein